jgi:hypothetical protein
VGCPHAERVDVADVLILVLIAGFSALTYGLVVIAERVA